MRSMEKMNSVKNGILQRLPPGFRFHPTDEELLVHYLKRKVLSFPLPAFIIPDLDLCDFDPWDLPGDWEKERYFFSPRKAKYPSRKGSDRATGSGYWKASGLDKQILASRTGQLLGVKKTLVFYRGKPSRGSRTDWIMHEYRLPAAAQHFQNIQEESWVLCRIFLKKRSGKTTGPEQGSRGTPVLYDFMPTDRTAKIELKLQAPASSDSSGITEVSSINNIKDAQAANDVDESISS